MITIPTEGEEITKAKADAWFTDIRDRLNALKPDDIADKALDTQMPDLAIVHATAEIYNNGSGGSAGITHTYTAAAAPYPGYDNPATSPGWMVVGDGTLSSAVARQYLSLTFTGIKRPSPTSDDRFAAGILIFCNIKVRKLYDNEDYPSGSYTELSDTYAAFSLQIQLAGSSWVHIAPTEEIINSQGPDNLSWALCLNNLIEPLSQDITGVRAVVSVSRGGTSVSAADARVELEDCNLTVIALRSGFISS